MPSKLICSLTLLALTLAATSLNADDKGRGKGGGGGQGRGGNGGRHFVDVSPWGVGYSYQGRGFGISVGPVGGGFDDGWMGGGLGGFGGPVFIPGPVIDPWMMSPGFYGAPGSLPADAHSTYYRPRSVTSTGSLPGGAWPNGYPGPVPGSIPYDAARSPYPAGVAGLSPAALPWADESLAAFAAGDYLAASRAAVHALVEAPDHGWLLLYAAQCHFAVQDHVGAANLVVSACDRLPPEAWGQVVGEFRDYYRRNDYITHVAALEQRIHSGNGLPAEWSLLGYHYLYLGHHDAARLQFESALQADPADPLASRLLPLTVQVQSPAPGAFVAPEPIPATGVLPPGQPEELVPPDDHP